MKMQPVKSSHIEAIGHDGDTTMRVTFTGGRSYTYPGITAEQFSNLLGAESVGVALRGIGVVGIKEAPPEEEAAVV